MQAKLEAGKVVPVFTKSEKQKIADVRALALILASFQPEVGGPAVEALDAMLDAGGEQP